MKPDHYGNNGAGGTVTASPTTTSITPEFKRESGGYRRRNHESTARTPETNFDGQMRTTPSKHRGGGNRADMSSEVSSSSIRNHEREDSKYWRPPDVTRRPADTSTRGATPLEEEMTPSGHRVSGSGGGRRGRRTDKEDGEMSGSDMDVDMDRPSPVDVDRGIIGDPTSKSGLPPSLPRRAIPPKIAQASSSSSSPRTPKPTSGMTPPLPRANGGATTAEADSVARGASPLVTASLADSSTPTQQLPQRSPLAVAGTAAPPIPQPPGRAPVPLMPPSPYSVATQHPPPPAPPIYASTNPTSTSTTSSQPTATDYMSYHATWAQDMGARAAAQSQRYYAQQQPHKLKNDQPLPASPWDMQHPYQQYPTLSHQQHPHHPPPGPPPSMQAEHRLPPLVPSSSSTSVDPQEKTIDKAVTRLAVDLKVSCSRSGAFSGMRNETFR